MIHSEYQELDIDDISLDYSNPRIAKYIEMYGVENLNGEAISLALGGGTDDKNGTTYSSLQESIKANNGIIHPIIVNKTDDIHATVIEGNTRVQIYRDLKKRGVRGNWNTIRAIVYFNLSENEIDAIRLQSHLVGPREWDPYSKAKYLNYLSNLQRLPLALIISFCGGKGNEVKKMINAYNDMEEYYRPNLDDDSEFDQKKFSAFAELQNRSILEALQRNSFSKDSFAKWVINENIDTMQNVRKLPLILKNEKAKKIFLKENVTAAMKIIAAEEVGDKKFGTFSYEVLASELIIKLESMEFQEIKKLKTDLDYEDKRAILLGLYESLDAIIDVIKED